MRRLSWIIQWVLNVVSRGDLRQKAMHLLKHCAVLLGLKGRSTSQGRQPQKLEKVMKWILSRTCRVKAALLPPGYTPS
jgi:hypothetical protein